MGHHLIEKMWVDQLPCWYLKALQKKNCAIPSVDAATSLDQICNSLK